MGQLEEANERSLEWREFNFFKTKKWNEMKRKPVVISSPINEKPKKLVKEEWGYSLWEDNGPKGFNQMGASYGGMFVAITLTLEQKKKLEETGECLV